LCSIFCTQLSCTMKQRQQVPPKHWYIHIYQSTRCHISGGCK
jgi:hypothetical protein